MRLYTAMDLTAALSQIDQTFAGFVPAIKRIPFLEANHLVLAENMMAAENIPAFSRSTVDGYAVRAQDTFGASESIPAFLTLQGKVEMGQTAIPLGKDAAVYVPTGGMLPQGADAVVMIEQTACLDDLVNIYKQVAPGENVIQKGEDVQAGQPLFAKGRRLKSADIAVLASLGITEVAVYQKPRVAVLSTGDELVDWQCQTLPLGKIRDCNGPAIMTMTQNYQGVADYGGIVADDYPLLKKTALALLANHDILVLSGGSSVGARDYTTQLLQELGSGQLLVEGIAIQPGKPTLLANVQGKAVLGLPGHPVSAINIFALLGKRLLYHFSGEKNRLEESQVKPVVSGRLTQNIPSQPGRTDVIRVEISKNADDQVEVTPVWGRSGLLRSLRDAQGVLMVSAEQEGLPAGAVVDVMLLE